MSSINEIIGKQLYRTIKTFADGIIVINLDGRVAFINTSAEKLLGLKNSDVVGRPMRRPAWNLTTVDGKYISDDKLPFAQVMRTGKPVHDIELAFIRPDGRRMILSINAAPLRDEDGRIAAVMISMIDITARKTAETRLKESEERYRRLIEVSPDLIAVHSDWRIVYINPAGAHMLGAKKPAELMGRPILSFIHPEFRKVAKERFLTVRRDKVVGPVEEEYVRLDGDTIDVEVIALPIVYQGTPAVQVVARDITERKRNEASLREAKELSDALNRINGAINSTLDFHAIMQRVVTESAKVLESETAGISLIEEDHWVTRYVYGLPKDIVGRAISSERAVITSLAARTKKPVAINDVYEDTRVNLDILEKHGLRSFMVVPLVVRGDVIGALAFNYYSKQVNFTDDQIDFANKLSTSISLALENARLYSAERNIADTLQEAVLTMPEHIEGIEFGHLYRSATEATRVGGDFYDLFEIERGKVGIVTGDVSGKGLEAATLASLIKNTIKAYAYEDLSPSSIMAKVNKMITKETGPQSFATLFLGILDIDSKLLTYCSAGHPQAILTGVKRGPSFLAANSSIVGAFLDLQYVDDSIALEEGDTLILYTDGATEARCDDGFYGEDRLIELIDVLYSVSHALSPKEIPRRIFSELIDCTHGRLSDDVALLAVSLAHFTLRGE